MRKSVIPDPQIVLTLMAGTIAILTGKKIADKISDSLSDDAMKIYELIRKVIMKTVVYCKRGNKPITYVLEESNDFLMELVIVTTTPDILMEALTCEKIKEIKVKIDDFTKNIDIDIAKMQCLYDETNKVWEINYISTKDGKLIGSEKCYKKTVKLKKNAGTGLSIGIIGEIEENM